MILNDRFFPPPLLTQREENGRLRIADPVKNTKGTSFLPLFQRLSINLPIKEGKFFPIIPYDYHCPTVQENLPDRTCPFCNLYYATMKNLRKHRKAIHPGQRVTRVAKKIPAQIIKRRNEEVLCIINNEDDAKDAEWCLLADIITNDTQHENQREESNDSTDASERPLINSIAEWLQCDWSDDV